MKYLIIVLGLFILFVASGIATAGQTSKEVNVFWTVGPGCWVKLNVHGDVDLGTVDFFTPGDKLVSDRNNLIHVVTNCQRFTLAAEVIDIQTPHGFEGSIPNDFYWKVAGHPHGPVLHDWATLTQRNMVNTPFVIETAGNGNRLYNVGYKYILDALDIPGDYLVKFLYTVTAP